MGEACTKCGGIDHYGREVKADGDSIDLLPVAIFKSGYYEIRICGACGFTEFRVPARFLTRVREKFPKVP